jgi:HEAT repeat protein
VKPDVLRAFDSLSTLGGADAARAALEALPIEDPEVRDRAFAIVEKERPKELVKTLAALPDDRRHKRDFDVHRRVAHALAVIADVSGIEPLTGMLLSEDPQVVASAADALATFASAPHRHRVEPVKRMIDLYEGTWNVKESIRPEDRVAAKHAAARWEAFGKSLRAALQALARQTITRPAEWRRWWNDHKKDDSW